MKQSNGVVSLIGLIGLLAVTTTAGASSVGLPEKKTGFSASVEYGHVFDQDLEPTGAVKNIEIDESKSVLTKLSYDFNENYSLYAKLGTADLESKLIMTSAGDNAPYTLDYDFGFAWGVGGKASYPIGESGLRAILDIQYVSWESSLDSMKVNNVSASSVSASDVSVSDLSLSGILAKEWTLGNGRALTPYLGAKFSKVNVDYGTATHAGVVVGSTTFLGFVGDANSDDNVGIVTGVEYEITDSLSLNVEGRFIDETAATASLKYSF